MYDNDWGEQPEDWSGGGALAKRLDAERPQHARRVALRARAGQLRRLPRASRFRGAPARAARACRRSGRRTASACSTKATPCISRPGRQARTAPERHRRARAFRRGRHPRHAGSRRVPRPRSGDRAVGKAIPAASSLRDPFDLTQPDRRAIVRESMLLGMQMNIAAPAWGVPAPATARSAPPPSARLTFSVPYFVSQGASCPLLLHPHLRARPSAVTSPPSKSRTSARSSGAATARGSLRAAAHAGAEGRHVHDRAGRVRRDPRPERLGQVDARPPALDAADQRRRRGPDLRPRRLQRVARRSAGS